MMMSSNAPGTETLSLVLKAEVDQYTRALGRATAAVEASDAAATERVGTLAKEGRATKQNAAEVQAAAQRVVAATKNLIRANDERIRQLKQEKAAEAAQVVVNRERIAAINAEIQKITLANQAERARINALRDEVTAHRQAAAAADASAKSTGALTGKVNLLIGAVTAFASGAALTGVVRLADQFKGLEARVGDALGSFARGRVAFQALLDISSQTGAQLADTVSVFERLSFAAREVGKTTQDALRLTQLVQQIGAINQVSDTNLSAGLLQFGQALSAGIVRAEEFNSIIENIPGLAREIAIGLGTTVGQLRQAVLDGKVLSKDVFEALEKRAESIEKRFAALPPSLQRSGQALSNSFGNLALSVDRTVGVTATFATALKSLAGILDSTRTFIENNGTSLKNLSNEIIAISAGILAAGGAVFAVANFSKALVALQVASLAASNALKGLALIAAFNPAFLASAAATAALTAALAVLAGVGIYAFVKSSQQGTEAAKIMGQSQEDLRNEVEALGTQALSTTEPLSALGKRYDELASRTNRTQAEQDKMNQILEIARSKLPTLQGPIDGLISKYGSLEKAIRAARLEQAALLQEKAIDDKIQRLKTARDNASQRTNIVFGVPGAGAVTSTRLAPGIRTNEEFAIDQQIAKLEKERGNVRKNTERLLDDLQKVPTGGRVAPIAKKAKKAKTKKGPSAESQDSKALRNLQTQINLPDNLQSVDLNARESLANLGPLGDELRKTEIDAQATAEKIRLTEDAIARFKKLNPKSKEGQAELRQFIKGLENDLRALKITLIETRNTYEGLTEGEANAIRAAFDKKVIAEAESALESFNGALAARQEALKKQYDEGLITAEQYYDGLKSLITEQQTLENDVAEAKIAALLEEKKTQKDTIEGRKRILEIDREILAIRQQQNANGAKAALEIKKVDDQALADDRAERLKKSVTDSLTEAITDVLSGQSTIKGAIKKFAQSLRNAVAQELANAIKQRFIAPLIGKLFDSLFPKGGGLTPPGSAPGGSGGTKGAGLSSALGGLFNIGKATGATAKIGGFLGKIFGIGGAGAAAGGAGAGAAGGLAAAAPILLPLLAAGVGGFMGVRGIKKGNTTTATIGGFLLGGIGGAILFNRLANRNKKSFKAVQAGRDVALGGLTEDNLNLDDLNNRLNVFSQIRARGKRAKGLKQETINELNNLIILRRQQIDAFIADIQKQNKDLERSVLIADAKPFEQAVLERKYALEDLASETAKLLNQYRDSQTAQTEILKQESLKRREIDRKAQEQFRSSIEDTQQLLERRDEVANANVFTRRQSAEAVKAAEIADIDKSLNQRFAELNALAAAGVALPTGIAGAAALTAAARQIVQTNQFQIVINQAADPNALTEAMRRQLAAIGRGLSVAL